MLLTSNSGASTLKERLELCVRPAMEIDVRAVRKLRESSGAQAAFGPMIAALCESDVDLAAQGADTVYFHLYGPGDVEHIRLLGSQVVSRF